MKRAVKNHTGERGAVLVHVALGMIAFMALSALSIDYGVKWVGRAQAQNAADAGALAGATALAFDSPDRTDSGIAKRSARAYALSNGVWGASPDVQFSDITFPACPPPDGDDPTSPGPFNCIRVDVYRNVERSNPLPTFFAQLVGVTEQGVRATATAKLGEGNSVKCLLPFGVADRWADFYDPTPVTTYFSNDGMGAGQGPSPLGPGIAGWSMNDSYQEAQGDVYRSPLTYPTPGMHTGWTVEADYGRQLILKFGGVGTFSAGWANKVDLPGSTGANDYEYDISHCNPNPISIAKAAEDCSDILAHNTTEPDDAAKGCVSASTGVSQGPTRQGVGDLVDQDDVVWDWDANEGQGAVVSADDPDDVRMDSPRIRPLIVFDISHYMSQACHGGTPCTTKVGNIIGFFVEGMCNNVTLDPGMVCDDPNKDVVGRIVTLPASYYAGGGNIADDAAFMRFVTLVR
ncbi:MAG TPA: pilus assembly protein TadG-related protein [Vicinamibacterales bacterium]|nr:pilus assembly protein TadG-related protein [Vicinamibacterales bacterium]